jgi:hypothetical protein
MPLQALCTAQCTASSCLLDQSATPCFSTHLWSLDSIFGRLSSDSPASNNDTTHSPAAVPASAAAQHLPGRSTPPCLPT